MSLLASWVDSKIKRKFSKWLPHFSAEMFSISNIKSLLLININFWKSFIPNDRYFRFSKYSARSLDLEQKYAGNASDADFIIGVHHWYPQTQSCLRLNARYVLIGISSLYLGFITVHQHQRQFSLFHQFFFFFSFSHVKLRILYCQVLCASFLNELCNEPKSVAWGILRVDFFFLMIEWNL